VSFEDEVRPILRTHCYRCHGATQQKGGLRLDLGSHPTIWQGDSGDLWQAGDAAESTLFQVIVGQHDTIPAMPYKKDSIPASEIETLRRWIDLGATIPASVEADARQHWSFTAPTRPDLPNVTQDTWPQNPIDFFILAKLEAQQLAPSQEARAETLLRRLALDLTGLAPDAIELASVRKGFTESDYQRTLDQLLASPHFGERWGRHWLDVARYADSNGYSIDGPRSMWRYRDWVIQSVNRDLAFDQFTLEQIAGDLLPDATTDQIVATGFHRNTQINQEGGIDPEQFRMEAVFDRMATTGAAFLGLTLGCAQCHEHKFDPITQEEYYRMFAFFNNQDEPNIPVPTETESLKLSQWESTFQETQKRFKAYEATIPDKVWQWEKFFDEQDTETYPEDIRSILKTLPANRSEAQKAQLLEHFKKHDSMFQGLVKEVQTVMRKRPRVTTAMVLRERAHRRETHLLIKGDFTRPDKAVQPGVPAALHPLPPKKDRNRLDLARWLAARDNPLTARVIMNRMWQQYFGKGLVETENDFGTQGTLPSHPALLDWLACEFMDSGWSMKHMHRLIVSSATYRQSSRQREDLKQKDPRNLLLGRQNRVRLEAETVRDVALVAADVLDRSLGGPSVFPPQPKGVMKLGQVQRSWRADQGKQRFRRGMYTFHWRATPHPALSVFDSPDAFSTCTRRIRSNTPLQALTLLNDPAFHEMATAFAHLIASEGGPDDASKIRFGFQRCTSRQPNQAEMALLLQHIDQERASTQNLEPESRQQKVWMSLARILLNLDETITRE